MTSYIVLFSDEVLAMVREDPSQLPGGFRVGEVLGLGESYRSVYVRVEDDWAPADFEGRHVELTLRRQLDAEGQWCSVVSSRRVVDA